MLIMPKRIPEETKQRAIRLVLDHLDEYPNLTTACETVARRLGFGAEGLGRWAKPREVVGHMPSRRTVAPADPHRLARDSRDLGISIEFHQAGPLRERLEPDVLAKTLQPQQPRVVALPRPCGEGSYGVAVLERDVGDVCRVRLVSNRMQFVLNAAQGGIAGIAWGLPGGVEEHRRTNRTADGFRVRQTACLLRSGTALYRVP